MHHVDSNNLDETNFAPEFYTTYDNDLTTYKEFTENCLVIVFTKPMNIGSILLSFPDSDEDKDKAPSYSVYGVDQTSWCKSASDQTTFRAHSDGSLLCLY